MLNKQIAVIFSKERGAKLLVNPDNLEELSKREDVLINPDLREVRGLPLCFWAKRGGEVWPMNSEEVDQLRADLAIENEPFIKDDTKRLKKYFVSKRAFIKVLTKALEEHQTRTEQRLKNFNDAIGNETNLKLYDSIARVNIELQMLENRSEQRALKINKMIKVVMITIAVTTILEVLFHVFSRHLY